MTLRLAFSAHSETGPVRKNNQDSCYASESMLIVADGMGGAAAGDLASAVVIKEMRNSDTGQSGENMLAALTGAVQRATAAIAELIDTDADLDGMGSTATGVVFDGERLGVVNIGDSRTYVFRDGELKRLTHDHSWVQSLVDEGRITEEESLIHPHRSLILRVINGQPQHVPDMHLEDLCEGDRLLICSDGLCGLVTDAAIARNMDGPRDEVMKNLIEIAYEQGGLDNITIILADAKDEPDDEPQLAPVVLGAAANLDLDAPLDTLALSLPPDDTGDTDEALPAAVSRPDPGLPERARYAPTSRRRASTWVKVVLSVVVALAVIGFGGWAAYVYTQQQYFVGPNGDYVALFQGIPDPVFNLPLSNVVETRDFRVTDLPTMYQKQVLANTQVASLDAGRHMLTELQAKARDCINARQGVTPGTQPPASSVPPTTTPGTPPTTAGTPPATFGTSPAAPAVTPTPVSTPPPTSDTDLEGCG